MIRILHVVPTLDINAGMMSVIMNYYRHIDRKLIQFDFVYFKESKIGHRDEIKELGGRIFFLPHTPYLPQSQKVLRSFFQEHRGEFTAVHCHPIWSSAVFSREARRSRIGHVIQHIHSTRYSEKKISAWPICKIQVNIHQVFFVTGRYSICQSIHAMANYNCFPVRRK